MDQLAKSFKTEMSDGTTIDVAIIGGGASGLYSGYRLLTGTTADGGSLGLDVHIFELSGRIGGRLQSVTLPGMDVTGELGGMRYMTSQQIVTALIQDVFAEEYGLQWVPFPMGDPAHHLYYLRKQLFPANSWAEADKKGEKFQTRYELSEKYLGLSSDQIFMQIVSQVLEADGYSLSEIQNSPDPRLTWNDVKMKLKYNFSGPYDGRMVYQIGFWNLIKDQSSQECYEFLAAAGGYYSNTINWNAAEAFPYMVGDFADANVQYRTIQGGYDQVLWSLARAFIANGGTIHTTAPLLNFSHNETGNGAKYALTFYDAYHEQEWTVYANDIILAMPRRSLELLNRFNFFFDPETQQELNDSLDSVIIEPSYKILLGFETPWWRDTLQAVAGESITDLPMRQCYYFGVDDQNQHALLLASYNDMRSVPFWKVLEDGIPFEPKPTRLVSADDHALTIINSATTVMVAEVLKELEELHGFTIPQPYTSAYKDWSVDPYGGGYHAWKANRKVWKIMPYTRRPLPEESVYIVGEAYSDQQGWVEGAFCVTEHIMRDYYNLVCPPWLNANYYLGW